MEDVFCIVCVKNSNNVLNKNLTHYHKSIITVQIDLPL